MKSKVFIFLLQILPLITPAQHNFQSTLDELLSQPEFSQATVGICINDVETGKPLFEYNPGKFMIPASTLKIITSAAALEILGKDYRFTTSVGFSGNIKNQTLNGNLVIVGGGDPTLGSEYFRNEYENPHFLDTWAQKIKAAGISKINGDLVFDGSLYDSEKIPPTWIWEDIGNYYGTVTSAFAVYDNLFRITFSSPPRAGEPVRIISTFPEMEGLEITNHVLSSDVNRDQAYVFGSPLDNKREITGTIPKNRKSFTIKAAVHQPEKLLAADFIDRLAKAGVFLKGEVKIGKVEPEQFHAVYIQESPTLAEIVKVLNHESVNLFAEHLVKQIAAVKTGMGSREKGIELIQELWKSKGMDSRFFMEDGSGLSDFNAVTPAQFTYILNFMMNEGTCAEPFFQSLPGASNGTLSGFDSAVFPGNTIKAKSGSMTRVRCYAGYLKLDSGRLASFSVMFNHFPGNHSGLVREIQNLLQQAKSLN
jgi:D-alanyl-D-alanine carboxypeptidase/D-alanyl-D-alanine-endopeptidase (penicillin-binding protein 4)